MVQYYHDLWEKCSQILAPLTDLVNECGHIKVTRAKMIKKYFWHWNKCHQEDFGKIKRVMAHDVTLTYSYYY